MDVSRLARVIASSQADIVALNEVFHPLVPTGISRPAGSAGRSPGYDGCIWRCAHPKQHVCTSGILWQCTVDALSPAGARRPSPDAYRRAPAAGLLEDASLAGAQDPWIYVTTWIT